MPSAFQLWYFCISQLQPESTVPACTHLNHIPCFPASGLFSCVIPLVTRHSTAGAAIFSQDSEETPIAPSPCAVTEESTQCKRTRESGRMRGVDIHLQFPSVAYIISGGRCFASTSIGKQLIVVGYLYTV